MAQTALPAHAVRRRAFFGMFDADGWSWAIVKSLAWFVIIIVMLGYIPDRAYYFTVQKTVDIGVLGWSPINFCPPENETLPCPAPAGASLPWYPNPPKVALPAVRSDAAAAVLGTTFVVAGGTDGTAPSANTFISHSVGSGNIDVWSAGPALPEARSDAAFATIGSTLYVIGGYGPDGKPTSTVYSLTVAADGSLGEWKTEDAALPAARAGASAVAVSDGLVVLGGTDGTAVTNTAWKAQLSSAGKWSGWVPQQPLAEANINGTAMKVGDVIYLIGGTNDKGEAVATVQMALAGRGPNATAKDPNVIDSLWMMSAETNLPGPRTNLSGFTSNGVIYVQGGSDGGQGRTETLWAQPDANGVIAQWNHLAQTDLGEGIQGAAAVVSGPHAFIIGGATQAGPTGGIARAYLAPQPPFFQLGVLGATIPALQLGGEIGQQIGYLNAAGVGTVNFVVLLLVAWAFNHKEQVRARFARRKG